MSTASRRGPQPMPTLTEEQIAHKATWLYGRLRVLVAALDDEQWDGRWGNKLMSAWLSARRTIRDAATWTPPEAVAASDSPSDSGESDPQRESETTAVEACRTSPEA